jgi:hypothetical protein
VRYKSLKPGNELKLSLPETEAIYLERNVSSTHTFRRFCLAQYEHETKLLNTKGNTPE